MKSGRSTNSAPKEKSHRERRREAREQEARDREKAWGCDEFAEPYEGDTFGDGVGSGAVEFSLPSLVPKSHETGPSGGILLPDIANKPKEARQEGLLHSKREPRGEHPDFSMARRGSRREAAADRKPSAAEPHTVVADGFLAPRRKLRRHSVDSSSLPDIHRDNGLEVRPLV